MVQHCGIIILVVKQFSNEYHYAIKKILKIPKWESNQLIFEATGLVTFDRSYSNSFYTHIIQKSSFTYTQIKIISFI